MNKPLLGVVVFSLLSYTFGAPLQYTGVNEAGLEFGTGQDASGGIPGTYGSTYTSPTTASADYFIGKGMNIFRLPFRWERLQPAFNGSFDSTYLGYIDSWVNHVTGSGAHVIIEPHNYCNYRTNGASGPVVQIGVSTPAVNFANFWNQLATHYKDNHNVWFNLMNEPNNIDTTIWLADANAAIAGIRAAGATNVIVVPGNAWTGAHSWSQTFSGYSPSNADTMTGIVDSGNNFLVEVHQYLDGDYSGTSSSCQSNDVGVNAVTGFTTWCRQHGYRGFLGEFAGGNNAVCQTAVDNLLTYMEDNSDVWVGWTWWAAGPWWSDYMYTLEPGTNPVDQPQMAWLAPHITGGATATGSGSGPVTTNTGGGDGTPTDSAPTGADGGEDGTTDVPNASVWVYRDGVESGVEDWSWATTYSLQSTTTVKNGQYSISWTPSAFDAIYFQCPSNGCWNSGDYTGVEFWVNGGSSGGQSIRVQMRSSTDEIGDYYVIPSPTAGTWTQVYVSFVDDLHIASGTPLDGVEIQANLDAAQGALYLDDIVIVDRVGGDGDGDGDGSASTLSSWLKM